MMYGVRMNKLYCNFSKQVNTKGKQLFSVPNTDEGQHFLWLMSKYCNHKKHRIVKHGRGGGADAKRHLWYRDTPMKSAKWIAVYIDRKKVTI